VKAAILGTAIGGVILAVLGYIWKTQSVRLRRWWSDRMAEADETAEDVEFGQLETLREQVADRARKLGIPMPVSSNGNHITYADGHTTLFIPDYQAYRHAMESRRVDILNTVNKEPPTPLSHRGRAWLEEWLAEHLES